MERCPYYGEHAKTELKIGDIGMTNIIICDIDSCPYDRLDKYMGRCISNGLISKADMSKLIKHMTEFEKEGIH